MSKKLLVLDISYLSGNNRTPIIEKIKYWQKHGDLKITMFCTHQAKRVYEQNLKNIEYITIKYSKNPSNRFLLIFEDIKRNFLAVGKLSYLLKQKFDAIYSISAVLDLVIFPRIFKLFSPHTKWLVVFDNTVTKNAPGHKIIKLLAYIFYRWSLYFIHAANVIFVVTKQLQTSLKKERLTGPVITITGNGVEADLIRKTKTNKKIYDALFIGRINETKGIYDMLEVLSILVKKRPGFKLAVMGEGDELSEQLFKDKINDMGLRSNVFLLGFKTKAEKFKIIKQSKTFLFLSPSESFGVALLEAVCSGLPAFVYNLEAYRYIYRHNEVYTFPVGKFQDIASTMDYVISHQKLRNVNGEKLINYYNWHNIAQIEYEAIIR